MTGGFSPRMIASLSASPGSAADHAASFMSGALAHPASNAAMAMAATRIGKQYHGPQGEA